jgi:hypothetical protein
MLKSFKNILAIIIGTRNKKITPEISHKFEVKRASVKLIVIAVQYIIILF